MLNKGTASLEVSRSHEQRAEPRVREFREFGTASLRGITVLFQLRRHGHPQNDATPNFFADSKRPIKGLSNEVSFVPKIL